MKLKVEALSNKEKDFIDFDLEENISSLNYYGVAYNLISPIHISGRISRAGRNYFVKSTVDLTVESSCSRCLVDVSCPIKYNIDAYLMREEYDEGDYEDYDVFRVDGSEIDFMKIVNSTLSFNMPQRILCSEDCQGICSGCGVDLNFEECKCDAPVDTDDIDPRFAKLKELLK